MEDLWYLDSGCSTHIARDKSKFMSFTLIKGGQVTFRDNSKGKFMAKDELLRHLTFTFIMCC